MSKIIIGADIVPIGSNEELFAKADVATLIGEDLKKILNTADYRVFNLETVLTDEVTPIEKWGPNLISPTNTINGLKAIGIDLVTLANNHSLDQGQEGLDSTLAMLKSVGIKFTGIVNSDRDIPDAYITDINGIKIGVYGCVEREFTHADSKNRGANPYDPLVSFDFVADLRQIVDHVIVLYHGGKEHYRYPSPDILRICRKFVDKGASLVITQHTHCIGCYEKYQNGTILYGQGNFLFDHSENEYWQTALLVEANIDKTEMNVNFIPVRKHGNKVRLAINDDADNIINAFKQRSNEINDIDFVEKRYKRFADENIGFYLHKMLGRIGSNIIFRIINQLCMRRLSSWLFTKSNRLAILDYYICDAHRELIITALKK